MKPIFINHKIFRIMKKILLFIFTILSISAANAQKGNLILFSQEGERFFVVMNGIQQNQKSETNVAIRNMPQGQYIVKIIFEDKSLGVLNDKISVFPNVERTFNIKKKVDNTGVARYVTRWVSENPIPQVYDEPAEGTSVIVYQAAPVDGSVTQTTSTTTTTSGSPDGVNINMNVGMGGMGGGVNINTSGMDIGSTTTTTTTRTTTTSTTSTNGDVYEQPAPQERVVYVPGYNGPIGCPMPMNPTDFAGAKASISSKSFEETKLQSAKQIVGANCCTANQVKEIMRLFNFEASKLDFAKFAYKYTYDQKNYYKVNDAFEFESSISELTTFIGQ